MDKVAYIPNRSKSNRRKPSANGNGTSPLATLFFPFRSDSIPADTRRGSPRAAVVRYLTYLRLSNYSYGADVVSLSNPELTLLDGISERSARRILRELWDVGLIKLIKGTGKGHPASVQLIHPWLWPDLEQVGAGRL